MFMGNIGKVFGFGRHYLRRYWTRLAAGVLLGVLFGLTNASFVWATKVMIGRMAPAVAFEPATTTTAPSLPSSSVETNAAPGARSASRLTSKFKAVKARSEEITDRIADPWLPRLGRAIDWRECLGGLLLLPALMAARGFSGYLSSYCLSWVSERIVNDLRGDVLEKLSGLSLDFFNRSTMGDLLTRVNGDTGMLQRCLSLGVGDLIKEPVTLVVVLLTLCVVDWQLTLWAVLFVPLCVVPVIVLGRKVRRASTAGWGTNISQSSFLVEILSGIRVVKAFGLEAMLVQRFRKMSQRLVHFAMKTVRAREQVNPIIETVSMLGVGLLMLYIIYQQRRIDDMVGYLTGLIFLYTPVKKLAALHVLFQQTRIGVDRLTHILAEQPTVKEQPNAKPVSGFRSAIVFENVGFSYGNAPVLQDISLEIPRGQKLGIAGESGSGKSTLVNLVFRFYDPTAGAIRLAGLDLREARLSDLRSYMALVSQEIVLFNETVAENIAYGKPGATREEVEMAAKAAFAHDFILMLPQGYETQVGEKGVTLSGGQRQRLAIARAFIRNAPLLVLDEATGSLDSHAEAEVQAAIDRLEENRTVICVAHRLSTLTKMDRIIVLSQGRIVEQGTFQELLQQRGAFTSMARKQGIAG